MKALRYYRDLILLKGGHGCTACNPRSISYQKYKLDCIQSKGTYRVDNIDFNSSSAFRIFFYVCIRLLINYVE